VCPRGARTTHGAIAPGNESRNRTTQQQHRRPHVDLAGGVFFPQAYRSRIMTSPLSAAQRDSALRRVEAAVAEGKLTRSAADHIRAWLTEPRYADYAAQTWQHIEDGRWQQLDDVFWTVIPFGTGGRRGAMYPIGCNAINDRTIGESAQGLADYVLHYRRQHASRSEPACAIAYDTRHRSPHFARLCAEIMAANGFRVYFLDGHRSTPALSVAVRHKQCDCGIMVTASHNPPSDNAVKVYWSDGAQLLPPHDAGVIDCVMRVQDIRRTPFDDALRRGQIVCCQEEIDRVYLTGVVAQSFAGPRELKIVYSPMHGVGATSVVPALRAAGFQHIELYGPHAEPDPDFPNVPGHVANPENPRTFDGPIQWAQQSGADVVLSTDPDADRLGAAAPDRPGGTWRTLNGNQLAALLCDYILQSRQRQQSLSPQHYIVKTLVTTDLLRRIAQSYGVQTYGDLLVGFKWIAREIDLRGPEYFLFAAEESHGYQAGTYARDKDGAVAALLLAELAAQCKAQGQTLHQRLHELYTRHGCHLEGQFSLAMPGSQGMARTAAVMEKLRTAPPQTLAGLRVERLRDYQRQVLVSDGRHSPLDGPRGELVIFDLESPGNYVAIRPSGTEPKLKFYLFGYEPPGQQPVDEGLQLLQRRHAGFEQDLRAFAAAV
jgi:phosphomannomutase